MPDNTTASTVDNTVTEPETPPLEGSNVEEVPEVLEEISVKELTKQLADAQQKANDYWDTILRKQAEHDNLQKRMIRDLDNARKYALEKFATEILAIKDSMELGLEAADKPETSLETINEGMTLTLKMLTDSLEKFNIVEINPINEKFDPQWHEAMTIQPSAEVDDGTVLHMHQKGYKLQDRLLRPARVIVSKKPLENQD
ncbi:nucleotide exchange factor GrpE [Candidatus Halobeggiatoa sp. HSG11]|nr:nucleotide exchange factor GrpE [Candidatus Halobeggiatoa sp. HSG11]